VCVEDGGEGAMDSDGLGEREREGPTVCAAATQLSPACRPPLPARAPVTACSGSPPPSPTQYPPQLPSAPAAPAPAAASAPAAAGLPGGPSRAEKGRSGGPTPPPKPPSARRRRPAVAGRWPARSRGGGAAGSGGEWRGRARMGGRAAGALTTGGPRRHDRFSGEQSTRPSGRKRPRRSRPGRGTDAGERGGGRDWWPSRFH
jgi:hypothetical protein